MNFGESLIPDESTAAGMALHVRMRTSSDIDISRKFGAAYHAPDGARMLLSRC
jgi:hypothetical protein